MNKEELRLVDPAAEFKRAFQEMAREWRDAGDDRFAQALRSFSAYLRKLRNHAAGRALGGGLVPQATFWLVADDGAVIGTSRLRHRLTAKLQLRGGHIGYDIRPGERGKGHGTLLLALTLGKARQRGMRRVLLTCDADNVASARIIVKNGGVLQSQLRYPGSGRLHQRYWIELVDSAT